VASLLKLVLHFNLSDSSFQPHFSELLTFGALISATDPVSTLAVFQQKRVDPQLFYLVFGESVLNDAVGLVLFETFSKFVGQELSSERIVIACLNFLVDFTVSFLGSLALGLASGVGAALLFKFVDMRQIRVYELSLFIMIMYLPFFAAEILQLSGIVTILFTGMAAKHYAVPNLSEESRGEVDVLFRVTAHLAETAIFLELGLSLFGITSNGDVHSLFILWAIAACLVGRAAHVYPITLGYNRRLSNGIGSLLANEGGNKPPTEILTNSRITANTSHMLWFSGLRGAVAYACAKKFPNNFGNQTPFVITTMVIVLVTVFFLGGTTELTLNALSIDMDVDEEKYLDLVEQSVDADSGRIVAFDKQYISPYVIRDYTNDNLLPEKSKRNESFETVVTMEEYNKTHSVEMTASGHRSNVRQMGVDLHRLGTGSSRRRSSIYDFGCQV